MQFNKVLRNNFKNMKKIAYIDDPLEILLKENFECVKGFTNRQKIKLYIQDLLHEDKYLQFILDHFKFCKAKDRNLMTRESCFHFDDKGNFITEDELKSYLCLPSDLKLKMRDERVDKDAMEQ